MITINRHQFIGVATVAGSGLIFSIMTCLIRYASYLDAYTLALFRFATGIALICVAAMELMLV